jgi:hypothetical protein
MRSESGTQRWWVKPAIPHKCVHLSRFIENQLATAFADQFVESITPQNRSDAGCLD